MAKSSCAEVRSHLYVALDLSYIPQASFQKIKVQAEEVARIIGGFKKLPFKTKSKAREPTKQVDNVRRKLRLFRPRNSRHSALITHYSGTCDKLFRN